MSSYIRLPRPGLLLGRQDFVIERCRGKRVLHLGCADAGQLAERYKRGELFHQKLAAVSAEIWGVDIDADAISFLRSAGYEHLITADVCDDLDQIAALREQPFDIVLAPEIVEHLVTPGRFLVSLRPFVLARGAELIVSVPNAFRLATLRWLLRGVEYVHPEHNYWFSYYTITNLLERCGYEIGDVRPYVYERYDALLRRVSPGQGRSTTCEPPVRRFSAYVRSLPGRALKGWLYARTPFFCDGLIVVAHATRDQAPKSSTSSPTAG